MKIIIILLLLYVVMLNTMPKRYIYNLPVIPLYPDNVSESALVYELTTTQTQRDIDFFEKTDYSIVYAFNEVVDIHVDQLFEIISQTKMLSLILIAKYSINRARPWQIDTRIKPHASLTDKTPSYPAGHAFQAYYLSNVLSKMYPKKKDIFDKIAQECDRTRILAGIHYPSDGEFSKKLVKLLI